LLLEDQRDVRSIKENLAAVPTLDSEGKRVLLDTKLKGGLAGIGVLVLGAWESLLLNLKNLKVGVVYLDVQTLICTKLVCGIVDL
jgi:hypothetical protein